MALAGMRSFAMHVASPSRRLTAELIGTALLLATAVAPGIMGERLCDGNVAAALLSLHEGGAP